MAGDIFNIGMTALLSYQRALGVTSNNVANVNTPGYNRQVVDFSSRTPQFTGIGFLGNGVGIQDISRVFSAVLTEELRSATALVGESSVFYKFASQLDNLVANPDAGIGPAIQDFFNAVNDVANDPASIPARQVMLTQAEELADRFGRFNDQFERINNGLNEELGTALTEINSITEAIANLNENIVIAQGAGNGKIPNDLLDQRDQLLARLSEHVSITVVEEGDGSANVFMGKGQMIVNRFSSQDLILTRNEFEPASAEIAYTLNGTTINITNQISGGTLGGVLTFRDQVLGTSQNALGRLATTFAHEFNVQHSLGIDLTGQFGGDFFSEPTPNILNSINNTGVGNMTVEITDFTALTTNDYQLTYDGSNRYTLLRLPDNARTLINVSGGYPSSTTVDGLTLTINAAPDQGDTFLIQPTKKNSGTFEPLISDASRIAAAAPVRGDVSLTNTGSVSLTSVSISDTTAYIDDDYRIFFGSNSNAAAGGPQGIPIDSDNDPGDVLSYQLMINDVAIHVQGEASAPLASLADLATAINNQQNSTGVRAYVDSTSGKLYLTNSPSSAKPITITESFAATSGALEAGDTVTGYFGSILNDTTTSRTVTVSATADSYVVLDGSGATVTSGNYAAGVAINFNGVSVTAKGKPNAGDVITVEPNDGGDGDNRNALALSALRLKTTIAGGTTTYQDAYGQMVATVGTNTHQAELSNKAQTALLKSTQDQRESLSGVNLDEEAANMLTYQQAYQAAAQVITTADELFQVLLGMMGR